MSLIETLEQLDELYYDDEENRERVIEALSELHEESMMNGLEEFRAFSAETRKHCGGVYIPFLMWTELSNFIDEPEDRGHVFSLIQTFVDSDFEDVEKKRMKALLITYFAMEREFELSKVQNLIVDKSHPMVQEYFRKVRNFVNKNKTSVEMYIEKFKMLRDYAPNFQLLRMPISKLKEHLAEVLGEAE